jgi:hypothetical protein
MNRRPVGATILSLLLGWLAVAGFGNALVWRVAPLAFDEPLPPRLAVVVGALQSPVLTVLAFTYGCTALAAASGLWRMRPWMASAFLAWVAVVAALFAWMLTIPVSEHQTGRLLVGSLFGLVVVGLLLVLHRYVKGVAQGAVRAAL